MSDLDRLRAIRDRVQYGIPPEDVIGDCRFLLDNVAILMAREGEFLYADAAALPPRRKRCSECGGEGKVKMTVSHHRAGVDCDELVPCHGCLNKHGVSTGYQEAP